MPLIKMATAARRARVGSSNTIRRALNAAGVPLVMLSPGEFLVEEADLNRFLANRDANPPPIARPKPPVIHPPGVASAPKAKSSKRRQ